MINEVTAVGDGSVTANFAVTLPCCQLLLMGCWLVYTELFSFSRLKLLFLLLGTKVSSARNSSFKAVTTKFRTLENIGSSVWKLIILECSLCVGQNRNNYKIWREMFF